MMDCSLIDGKSFKRNLFVLLLFMGVFGLDCKKSWSKDFLTEIDGFSESVKAKSHGYKILSRLTQLRSVLEAKSKVRSLQECLTIGLRQNMQLAAGYSSIQQQQYTKLALQRRNLPTLSLSAEPLFLGQIHDYDSTTTYGVVMPNQRGKYTVLDEKVIDSNSTRGHIRFVPQLTLTWSFFQPALWANIQSQSAFVVREQLAFDITARNAVLQIQESYYQLQSSKALVDAYEEIFQLNSEQVELVSSKYKAGLVDVGVLEQAKTQFYAQASDLIGYYEQYLQDAAELAFALNEPDELIITPDGKMKQTSAWKESLEDTVKQALDLREEIKQYLESENAYAWKARSAIRKYLPMFSFELYFSGDYSRGTQKNYPAPKLDQKLTSETTSVGLNLSWSFFDGGVAAAEASSYKAEARQAKYEAEYTSMQVREQVRKSYAKYKLSGLNLINSEANLKAAKNAYVVQVARFRVGLSDMTSIVQSIQLLGDAIQTRVDALLAYNESVAELYRYSAQWPDGIQLLVAQRQEALKKSD